MARIPPHLVERILAGQDALEARAGSDGERKTVTALFADIAGSMQLMEELDPEEARRIIDPVLQLMMDAVHRYEGYVVQSSGDGIFALFGAPIAHEDHPQRALYAALRMQEESRRYAGRLRRDDGVNLQIRVGANTGEMVLRSIHTDDRHTDYTPIAHATGLAQRMESLAAPGAVLVTEHTQKLTEGFFEFKSLGAARVKGVREPVAIYEVVGVGPLRTRWQRSARRGLVRFVGRQSELAQMRRALEQVKAGHGQIVGVVGEAGVGKSRLCHEFKSVAQSGCLVLETVSVSHGKAAAYLPLIELLRSYFLIEEADDEWRREKVTSRVLALDRSLEDTLPYLLSLLSIPDPTSSLAQMAPQIRRQRTFEAITRLLLRESLNQPLLLLVEDLHWLDGETEAFLNALSESVATARLLLLVTYRPEYKHGWGGKNSYTQLRLDTLVDEDAQELLAVLLGEEAVLQPLKRLLLEKSEGNPFFTEELVQSLFDEGVLVRNGAVALTRSVTEIHISATVQGVLAARIDRLGAEEKALLQTLAVLGKEFSAGLIRRVVDHPEEDLHRLLSRLQSAEFIYEHPAFPEIEYTFKHALTQEVAYNSVLRERRSVLHEHAAQAIEELCADRLEDHYSDLAHHYSHSGNTPKAVEYLQRAGDQAAHRSAYAEGARYLVEALARLETLPETPERSHHELTLQITLAPVLVAIRGGGAPEVGKAYTRARELCREVGETPQFFPALWGLWLFHFVRAELQAGRGLAEELLRLAQDPQDRALLLVAHQALGTNLFWQGEFGSAREHLEEGIRLYDPERHRSLAFLYGRDPGAYCLSYAALALWCLGYPDEATKGVEQAVSLAGRLSHPYSLVVAVWSASVLHLWRRERPEVQAQSEALIALASEQGFPLFAAIGLTWRGLLLAEQGQGAEAIAQMRQGHDDYRAIGTEVLRPFLLACLAEAHGKMGQAEEGLTVIAEALAAVARSGERFCEAELYRLQGELLAAGRGRSRTAPRDAEACFRRAIEVARRQEAKSWELRAAMSLSRLWQQQGKRNEARALLEPIYGWFTEGFETPDLQEARALLDDL